MVCKRVAVAAAVGLVSGLLARAVDAQVDDDDYWNDDEPAVENKKTDEKKLLIAVIVGGGSIIALLAVVVYIYTAPAKESIVLYSPASHNGHSFARHHRIRQSGRTAASWLGKSFYQRDSNSTFSSDHSNSIVQGKKPILPRDITNQKLAKVSARIGARQTFGTRFWKAKPENRGPVCLFEIRSGMQTTQVLLRWTAGLRRRMP
eukprot:m.103827 g.103827  ORF g.103827 m.103827 type:complete len:204 (-) comp12593_c0_seq2:272-883(-)